VSIDVLQSSSPASKIRERGTAGANFVLRMDSEMKEDVRRHEETERR
jgi:hypothetical protein